MNRLKLLTLKEVIGDLTNPQNFPGLMSMSRASWYEGIRKSIYPRPVKVGTRSYWREKDIQMLLESANDGELKSKDISINYQQNP